MSLPKAQRTTSLSYGASRATSSGALCLAVALLAAPLLTACSSSGFQPLYGTTSSGRSMTEVMANVDVAPIPGRVGQRLRNDLVFFKTGGAPGDAAGTGEYRLDIALREYTQSILVSATGLASGQVYHVDASFKLVRVKDATVVLQGNSYARAPYETNKVSDPGAIEGRSDGRSVFANVRAQNDAQNRASSTLANDIRTRVAAFLSGAA